MKKALTSKGVDSSGGAGIQADIKNDDRKRRICAMSAITALTAQNTTGITGIMEDYPEFLGQQLDGGFYRYYMPGSAVKIGMVSSVELIGNISEKARFYNALHIVLGSGNDFCNWC